MSLLSVIERARNEGDPSGLVAAVPYAGYLGHMWELYVMWAWIGVAAAASYGASLPAGEAMAWNSVWLTALSEPRL